MTDGFPRMTCDMWKCPKQLWVMFCTCSSKMFCLEPFSSTSSLHPSLSDSDSHLFSLNDKYFPKTSIVGPGWFDRRIYRHHWGWWKQPWICIWWTQSWMLLATWWTWKPCLPGVNPLISPENISSPFDFCGEAIWSPSFALSSQSSLSSSSSSSMLLFSSSWSSSPVATQSFPSTHSPTHSAPLPPPCEEQ